jgi:UDP-N-acetylmuramate--alanine ligase
MNIYISGISGTGMGPLAIMAKNAGHFVMGSDLNKGPIVDELNAAGIEYKIGEQDGEFLKQKNAENKIDWFVYTSALPENHPELLAAKELGIKTSKRDELIAYLVKELNLKMVAVAGTHGKTTTTSMIIWAAKQLNLPVSYLVGTTLGFAKSGSYDKEDKFFVYEADEYDRNFLHFFPWLSLVTFVSYDHPDIYKTEEDYKNAFEQFKSQSESVINGGEIDERFNLAGKARREDATTAKKAIEKMCESLGREITEEEIIKILNDFPGVGRRFERIADGVYSDYAHHPEEIAATIEMASEEALRTGKRGVVAVYEPHQNTRQHEVKDGYKSAFNGAEVLYWLPTYLTREDKSLAIISPSEFIEGLDHPEIGEPAEMNDDLKNELIDLRKEGYLILLMTAGPADTWLRQVFNMV